MSTRDDDPLTPDFPDAWCGLWVDSEGKFILIEKNDEFSPTQPIDVKGVSMGKQKRRRWHLEVSVGKKMTTEWEPTKLIWYSLRMITRWIRDDHHECDKLQAEAGITFAGPTYNIYFIHEPPGDEQTYFAKEGNPLPEIFAAPEVGIGLYDDWDDDLGVPWGFPYTKFHKLDRVDLLALLTAFLDKPSG